MVELLDVVGTSGRRALTVIEMAAKVTTAMASPISSHLSRRRNAPDARGLGTFAVGGS